MLYRSDLQSKSIYIVSLSSLISTIINKSHIWVRRLSYFIYDAIVPANFLNKGVTGYRNPLVRLHVRLQDTGLGSANPLGSLGSWEWAEVMARKDRGKGWSWKCLVRQHNGFPSGAGALPMLMALCCCRNESANQRVHSGRKQGEGGS